MASHSPPPSRAKSVTHVSGTFCYLCVEPNKIIRTPAKISSDCKKRKLLHVVGSCEGFRKMFAPRTVVFCLLFTAALFAQFETSEVLGTVHDPSSSPVPNANVTLTNQDTGIQMKTATDSNGNYDFFNVKVGRYTVAVEAS